MTDRSVLLDLRTEVMFSAFSVYATDYLFVTNVIVMRTVHFLQGLRLYGLYDMFVAVFHCEEGGKPYVVKSEIALCLF